MRTTHPVILEENRCYHYPGPLTDDKVLPLDRETPFRFRIPFRLLVFHFLIVGECLQVWESGVLVWAYGFYYWFLVSACRAFFGYVRKFMSCCLWLRGEWFLFLVSYWKYLLKPLWLPFVSLGPQVPRYFHGSKQQTGGRVLFIDVKRTYPCLRTLASLFRVAVYQVTQVIYGIWCIGRLGH